MEKADTAAVDPVEVKVGSGSDVEGEADVTLNDSGVGAPQGYSQRLNNRPPGAGN